MLLAFLVLIVLIYSMLSMHHVSEFTELPLNAYWVSGMILFIVGSYMGVCAISDCHIY